MLSTPIQLIKQYWDLDHTDLSGARDIHCIGCPIPPDRTQKKVVKQPKNASMRFFGTFHINGERISYKIE
jgi:hypothetical protein